MQVDFYHLTRLPLERALPQIAEKVVASGARLLVVSAFAGLETMKAAYAHAIDGGYRFYSYGDGSLLFRAA